MSKQICIIDGHPDPADHYIHAVCQAYADGAREAGHSVSEVRIADLDIPLLSSAEEFAELPPPHICEARDNIARAEHVMIAFPLWLGGQPAKLKAFLEQAARGEFFLGASDEDGGWPTQMMHGKSARVFVTMGMPGLVYRFAMDAGALKALERALLGISGFHPVKHTVHGGIDAVSDDTRKTWLEEARKLGGMAI
ncbi:MAG: NAD(P)H-dependent oxidoreductase [Pseudomonadota bacterium]